MSLPLLNEALEHVLDDVRPNASGDGIIARCPFCGGSREDNNSFSIRSDPAPGDPVLFLCFRASCGRKGILTTEVLEEIGIRDDAVKTELYNWNRTISKSLDKPFKSRSNREYVLVNVPTSDGQAKLKYINQRLGTHWGFQDLANYKIQLSILDLLRINDIRRISVNKNWIRSLDANCIGFISMYRDYMICRDITPDTVTGKRYYNYQISGKHDKDSLKVYSIPGEIDIMDPHAAVINVAEGPFSILGAYVNTDLGRNKPNNIWLANCGAQYENTIMRVCKQYGLLNVWINIWSDSEIKMAYYKKLYRAIQNRLDIKHMTIMYNSAAEDFGHPKSKIQVNQATIK